MDFIPRRQRAVRGDGLSLVLPFLVVRGRRPYRSMGEGAAPAVRHRGFAIVYGATGVLRAGGVGRGGVSLAYNTVGWQ